LPNVLDQIANGDNGERYAVLADSAFAASGRVIPLFRQRQIFLPEDAWKQQFNTVASGVRITVEKIFGIVNQHFLGPNFAYLSFFGRDRLSVRHKIACILTNIRTTMFQRNQISDFFADFPVPTYEYYLQLPPLPPGVQLPEIVIP